MFDKIFQRLQLTRCERQRGGSGQMRDRMILDRLIGQLDRIDRQIHIRLVVEDGAEPFPSTGLGVPVAVIFEPCDFDRAGRLDRRVGIN